MSFWYSNMCLAMVKTSDMENRWVFGTVISEALNTHDPTVNRELQAGRMRITLLGK